MRELNHDDEEQFNIHSSSQQSPKADLQFKSFGSFGDWIVQFYESLWFAVADLMNQWLIGAALKPP